MSSQENLARAQAQAQNFKMEKELLKSSEGRLLQEIESHRRERQSQSMLMANLEAIKVRINRQSSNYIFNHSIIILQIPYVYFTPCKQIL